LPSNHQSEILFNFKRAQTAPDIINLINGRLRPYASLTHPLTAQGDKRDSGRRGKNAFC